LEKPDIFFCQRLHALSQQTCAARTWCQRTMLLRRVLLTSGLAVRAVRGVGVSVGVTTQAAAAAGCFKPAVDSLYLRQAPRCFSSMKATAQPTTLLASARASLETLGMRGGCHHWRGGGGGNSLARQLLQRQTLFTRATPPPPPPPRKTNVSLYNVRRLQIRPGGARSVWSGSGGASGRGGGGGHPSGGIISIAKRVGYAVFFPLILAWKYKLAVLGALKLTKFASLASLAVTTAGYAMLFGVPYGVGVTVELYTLNAVDP
jgi:hypothetical protein